MHSIFYFSQFCILFLAPSFPKRIQSTMRDNVRGFLQNATMNNHVEVR